MGKKDQDGFKEKKIRRKDEGKGERKKGKSTRKENVGFGGEGRGNFRISESKKI